MLKKMICLVMVVPALLIADVTLRDGCTQEGDVCRCFPAGVTESDDPCTYGICLKGFHYGDQSIYCNCNLTVLNDEEIRTLQKKRFDEGVHPEKATYRQQLEAETRSYYDLPYELRLPTDEACAVKPLFGYDGKGFATMVAKLSKMQDDGELLDVYVARESERTAKSRQYGESIGIKGILNTVLIMVQQEINAIYQAPNETSTTVLPFYENNKDEAAACKRFKELLTAKLTEIGKSNLRFTTAAQNEFFSPCRGVQQSKQNLEPCFCGNTKKPGVCQVNACDPARGLYCHCD